MQTTAPQSGTDESVRERRPYQAPRIVHSAELETRAGTPTGPIGGNAFDPITNEVSNPWDPSFTEGQGQ